MSDINNNPDTEIVESSEAVETDSKKLITTVYDWIDSVVTSIIIVVLLFTFVFRVVGIVGDSMNDTLINNDRVVIYNLFYEPQKGDIIVISRNVSNDKANETVGNEPIIKRVIATEGQTVDITYDDEGIGHVFVDGVQTGESYIKEPMRQIGLVNPVSFPQTVPEGHVFVLGDNRNESLDSRSADIGDYGMIDERYVLGKAIFRIFPFNSIGSVYENDT